MQEQEVENILKDHLRTVAPSEEVFKEVLRKATPSDNKSPYMEASVSSPYQDHKSTFMNKFVLIGIPVGVVALAAVFFLMKPESNLPLAMNSENKEIPTAVEEQVAQPTRVTPELAAIPTAPVKTGTVDDIVDGFVADALADAEFAKNDTSDQAYIDGELSTVNNNTTLSYENII